MNSHKTFWEFRTAQFRVALEIEPEDMDPADSFEFQDDIDAVHNGEVEWFCARVAVYKDGMDLGSDYLGACAYKTVSEFYTSHRDPDPMNRNCSIMRAKHEQNVSVCHYFPDMVRQAVQAARANIGAFKAMRLRT